MCRFEILTFLSLKMLLVFNNRLGCHCQGKISGKWHFFQVREKSGNFVDCQGTLERTWKVREKSWNLKISGYSRQFSENLFILFKRAMDVLSHEIV